MAQQIIVRIGTGTKSSALTTYSGLKGDRGTDGISPIITVIPQEGGHTVQFVDAEGTKSFFVTNGSDGYTPQKGIDYFDGADGRDGADGVSPVANVVKNGNTATITITDATGTTTASISDGQQGASGFSPSASITKVGKVATISITDEEGTTTATISDGNDGSDGQDGADGENANVIITTEAIIGGNKVTFTETHSGSTASIDVMNGQADSISWGNVTNKPSTIVNIDTELAQKADLGDLDGLATEEYVDEKVAEIEVPTKTSDLTNDSGFITSSYHDSTKADVTALEDYATKEELEEVEATIPSIEGLATEEYVDTALEGYVSSEALETALEMKSDVGHGHVIADVEGLQSALNSKADVEDIPTEYIADASVSSDILTLTKADGTEVTFQGGGGGNYVTHLELNHLYTEESGTQLPIRLQMVTSTSQYNTYVSLMDANGNYLATNTQGAVISFIYEYYYVTDAVYGYEGWNCYWIGATSTSFPHTYAFKYWDVNGVLTIDLDLGSNNYVDTLDIESVKLNGEEKVSPYVQDSGVIANKIRSSKVTKTSELQNDSGYITNSYHDSTKTDLTLTNHLYKEGETYRKAMVSYSDGTMWLDDLEGNHLRQLSNLPAPTVPESHSMVVIVDDNVKSFSGFGYPGDGNWNVVSPYAEDGVVVGFQSTMSIGTVDKVYFTDNYYVYGYYINGEPIELPIVPSPPTGIIAEALEDKADASDDDIVDARVSNDTLTLTKRDGTEIEFQGGGGGGGGSATQLSCTIAVSDWSNLTARIAVTGITADEAIVVSPSPTSMVDAVNAQIYCSTQENGYLSFVCSTVPTVAITMNLLVWRS